MDNGLSHENLEKHNHNVVQIMSATNKTQQDYYSIVTSVECGQFLLLTRAQSQPDRLTSSICIEKTQTINLNDKEVGTSMASFTM